MSLRIAIVTVALALAGPPTVLAEGVNTKATLELAYHEASNFRQYMVTLEAKKHKCLDKRKVVVFKRTVGGDTKVLSFKSFDGTAYGDEPGLHFSPNDLYLAKVREKEVGDVKCRATESKLVTFQG